MADSYIQVAPDGTGKLMQTYLNTISANAVHAEAVCLVDSSGNPITTLNVNIGSSINANFTGTVNVAQSGTWNIGTLSSITNPVTVAQSNASNLAATVSGTVAATQSGTWNIGAITGNVAVTGPITNAQLRASEVSISAASLPLPALASTSTKQSDGSQKTQICDPINVSNVAGVTSGALNVFLASITANAGTSLNTTNVSVKILQGAATLASSQVTMSNVSTTIAGSRPTRRSATIRNQDTANSGLIGPAPIGTANGLLLYPGESISVDFTGVIAGISSTTSNVTFGCLETYD